MKKTIALLTLIFAGLLSNAQDVTLGESFTKWSKDFKLKGVSTKTNKQNYEYNKAISRLLFNRKVDVMYVTTKDNVVIGYIYMLVPKNNETGVPKDIVEQFEKAMNVKLIYNNGAYGIKDNDVMIQFSRNQNPALGGDRIMYYTALVKYL